MGLLAAVAIGATVGGRVGHENASARRKAARQQKIAEAEALKAKEKEEGIAKRAEKRVVQQRKSLIGGRGETTQIGVPSILGS